MRHWGLQRDELCLLCGAPQESRDHLYFECSYAWDLWHTMATRLGLTSHRQWDLCLNLCWQAVIYWVWIERNARLHRHSHRSVSSLLHTIDRQIKDKILSLRDSNLASSSALMQLWLLACDPAPQFSVISARNASTLFVTFH